jgi:hypothetical protein
MPTVIIHNDVLDLAAPQRLPVDAGLTVVEALALPDVAAAVEADQTIVSLSGRVLPGGLQHNTRLAAGDFLLVMPVAADDPWLQSIGMMAVMVVAAPAGAAMAGALGASGTGALASMLTIGVMVGGGLLIQSFATQPKKPTPIETLPGEVSASHGWAAATIQRPGVPRPRIYGRIRTPAVLVEGYRQVTGVSTNEQNLSALLCLGDGPLREPVVPDSLLIQRQPVDNFPVGYVDYETRRGLLDQPAVQWHRTATYETQPFIKVTNAGGAKTHTTYGKSFNALEIDLTFPRGLYDGTGATPANWTVDIKIEVRKKGSTVWQTLEDGSITDDALTKVIRTYYTIGTISLDVGYRYEIRVTKDTGDASDLYGDDLYLDSVREILGYALKRPGKALCAIRARETDQLSGSFQFSAISRGLYLRDVTDSYAVKYSRNFGLVLYDAFTQPKFSGSHSPWLDLECLLHFEGSNGDTFTYDEAPYGHAVTFYGNAQIDTTSPKFGSSRLTLDGTGDYISLDKCARHLTTNEFDDWTVDCWILFDNHTGDEFIFELYETSGDKVHLFHRHGSGFIFRQYKLTVEAIATGFGGEITDSNWHHIAVCKVGFNYGIYVDGNQVAFDSSANGGTVFGDLYVGIDKNTLTAPLHGSLDEFRIIRRNVFSAAPVSGLTDSFTAPASAYTDPGNSFVTEENQGYADSEMDTAAFVELTNWAAEAKVNPDKTYIDSITQETQAIITTRATSDLSPGDVVVFRQVQQNGMVELVDGTQATVLSVLDRVTLRTDLDTSTFSAYESLTKALWQFNGSDGATATSDASAQGHDIDASGFNGNAQIDTAQKKWGESSLYLDGTGDSLTLAADADWEILASLTSTWSIDAWVRHTDHAGTEVYLCLGGSGDYWFFGHVHGGGLRFLNQVASVQKVSIAAAGEITDTNWHHIAVVKVGSDIGTYLDGTQVGYDSMVAGDAATYGTALNIGTRDSADYFDGHIDELRINKSNPFEAAPVVGLTDTIDVPVAQYASEDFDDVDLLLHLDGADEAVATSDASPNGHNITFHGNAELDTGQFRFGISSLITATYTDYLSIPDSALWDICASATGDRTVDCWVRLNDHTAFSAIMSHYEDANNFWYLWHSHGSGIWFVVKSGGTNIIQIQSGGEITDSNWHHVAVCKVGDEYGTYVDGTQVGYAQTSSTHTATAKLLIGAVYEGYTLRWFDGHIDEIRVTSNNVFVAAPNVGLTDTIIEPTAEFADPALTGSVEEYLPRIAYDDVLTAEGNVWDAVRRMCQVARVTPFWRGSRVSVWIDKSTTPTFALSMGNIIRGTYRRRLIAKPERSSRIQAHYRDAADDYARTPLRVDSAALQSAAPHNFSRLDAFGITNRQNVIDLATFMLKQNEHVNWELTVQADVDAIDVAIGDVVLFQHDVANWGLIGAADQNYTGGGQIAAAANNDLTLESVDGTGLGGHWALNDAAPSTAVLDASGNGNDGTLNGGHNTEDITVAGHIDAALDLDGSVDDITCGTGAAMFWGSGDGTVCAWIKTTAVPVASADCVVCCGDYSGKGYFLYVGTSGTIDFRIDNGGSAKQAVGSTHLADGQWHFLVGRRQGNVIDAIVDGSIEATTDVTGYGDIDDATYGLTIGALNNTAWATGNNIAATIDDVRTFTRALSLQELATLQNNGPRATVRIKGNIHFDDPSWQGGSTRYNLMVKSRADIIDVVPIIGFDAATKEIAVTGPFTDLPQPGDIWAAGVENLQTRLFRVRNAITDEQHRVTLELHEYVEEAYADD